MIVEPIKQTGPSEVLEKIVEPIKQTGPSEVLELLLDFSKLLVLKKTHLTGNEREASNYLGKLY